jgi:hypothetical protein
VGSAASLTPFGLDLEQNHGLGILFRLRGQRTPPPDVVVVSIDKESADNLDLDDDVKNWPRSLHARLTENLAEKGASVIAFDVFFEEPTERGEDLAFAEAMRKANNVLLGERQQSEKLVLTGMKGKPGGEIEIARRIPPVPLLADASVATTPFPLPKVPIKDFPEDGRGCPHAHAAGRRVPDVFAFRLRRFPRASGKGFSRTGKRTAAIRGGSGWFEGSRGDDPGSKGDLRECAVGKGADAAHAGQFAVEPCGSDAGSFGR